MHGKTGSSVWGTSGRREVTHEMLRDVKMMEVEVKGSVWTQKEMERSFVKMEVVMYGGKRWRQMMCGGGGDYDVYRLKGKKCITRVLHEICLRYVLGKTWY